MLKGLQFLLIIVMLFNSPISGCFDSQFDASYKEFKKKYISVTDCLDSADPWGPIAKLNSEAKIKQIDKLKEIACKIEKEAKTDWEKKVYKENVLDFYDGVKFLLYAALNKDKLTTDERGRIATELTLVEMNRSRIEEGDI